RQVLERIETLFGGIEGKTPTPWPHTVEPEQEGERRVRLHAETDLRRFMIGWRRRRPVTRTFRHSWCCRSCSVRAPGSTSGRTTGARRWTRGRSSKAWRTTSRPG